MSLEISAAATIVCSRCGTGYKGRQTAFHKCNCQNYKGIGYLTVCKKCVDKLFEQYLVECGSPKYALRQLCRKLDLFWSEDAYNFVYKREVTKTIVSAYIAKINTGSYVGKSYDDTLANDENMWSFANVGKAASTGSSTGADSDIPTEEQCISKEVIEFWGPSYTPDMYAELEQRWSYWMSRFDSDTALDVGTEALIRQICCLEIDINRERAKGKQVDKLVNALNNILGSAQLRPTQKKDDASSANSSNPYGVWIRHIEDERPIPEADESLRDVDGLKKYISVWFTGHLAKMLGLKKAESKLYEQEIAKLRVERPEYNDMDDEEVFNDFFSDVGDESDEE